MDFSFNFVQNIGLYSSFWARWDNMLETFNHPKRGFGNLSTRTWCLGYFGLPKPRFGLLMVSNIVVPSCSKWGVEINGSNSLGTARHIGLVTHTDHEAEILSITILISYLFTFILYLLFNVLSCVVVSVLIWCIQWNWYAQRLRTLICLFHYNRCGWM